MLTKFSPPSFIDRLEPPLEIEGQEFHTVSDAWSFLRFLISMKGLVVNPEEPFSVRIEDDTVRFGRSEATFDMCHLFPSDSINTNLDIKRRDNVGVFRVLDMMKLPFCNVEKMKDIRIPESFIEEVRFYGKKKIVSISFLSKEQLTNFDYSDTMSRIYVEKSLLNESGLIRPLISPSRGPRKPKPVVQERVVMPMEEVVYESTERVKYYEHHDRGIILKTYRRNHTNI